MILICKGFSLPLTDSSEESLELGYFRGFSESVVFFKYSSSCSKVMGDFMPHICARETRIGLAGNG